MTTDERFDRIDKSIQDLTRYVREFRTETINQLFTIETRLDVLSATVTSVDSRIPGLTKAILDFGAIASQIQREQSRIAKLVEPAA